jgi:hypothetical protein
MTRHTPALLLILLILPLSACGQNAAAAEDEEGSPYDSLSVVVKGVPLYGKICSTDWKETERELYLKGELVAVRLTEEDRQKAREKIVMSPEERRRAQAIIDATTYASNNSSTVEEWIRNCSDKLWEAGVFSCTDRENALKSGSICIRWDEEGRDIYIGVPAPGEVDRIYNPSKSMDTFKWLRARIEKYNAQGCLVFLSPYGLRGHHLTVVPRQRIEETIDTILALESAHNEGSPLEAVVVKETPFQDDGCLNDWIEAHGWR